MLKSNISNLNSRENSLENEKVTIFMQNQTHFNTSKETVSQNDGKGFYSCFKELETLRTGQDHN